MSIFAWSGDKFAIGFLIAMLFCWTGMAMFANRSWRRSLARWESSLDGWIEANKLNADFASLIAEASRELAEYDSSKAEEILERASTISRLRAQNYAEKGATNDR